MTSASPHVVWKSCNSCDSIVEPLAYIQSFYSSLLPTNKNDQRVNNSDKCSKIPINYLSLINSHELSKVVISTHTIKTGKLYIYELEIHKRVLVNNDLESCAFVAMLLQHTYFRHFFKLFPTNRGLGRAFTVCLSLNS